MLELTGSIFPAASSMQTAVSVSQSQGQTKAADGVGFLKVLTGKLDEGAQNSTPAAVAMPNSEQLTETSRMSFATTETILSNEELMSLISLLLDQLDELLRAAESKPIDSESIQQLLEKLEAVMAMVGIALPVAIPQVEQGDQQANHVSNLASQSEAKGMIYKLQDALLHIQQAVQNNDLQHTNGKNGQLILPKVLEEARLLLDNLQKQPEKTDATQTFKPEIPIVSVPNENKAAQLQRLAQQSVAPLHVEASGSSNVVHQQVQSPASTENTSDLIAVQLGTARYVAPQTAAQSQGSNFVMADQFADTMRGFIMQKFSVHTLNGVTEAKLKLFPEQLGQVDVKISMQNGVLTAVFQTERAMAKDLLDGQMAQLRSALQAQGLHVDKLVVSQDPSNALDMDQHDHERGKEQARQQAFSEQNGRETKTFEEELMEQAVIQQLGYGRAINEMV